MAMRRGLYTQSGSCGARCSRPECFLDLTQEQAAAGCQKRRGEITGRKLGRMKYGVQPWNEQRERLQPKGRTERAEQTIVVQRIQPEEADLPGATHQRVEQRGERKDRE